MMLSRSALLHWTKLYILFKTRQRTYFVKFVLTHLFFQLLEEEDTFPDDFIASIEAMLAALDENTEMLFSESLSELNKLEATMRKASIE